MQNCSNFSVCFSILSESFKFWKGRGEKKFGLEQFFGKRLNETLMSENEFHFIFIFSAFSSQWFQQKRKNQNPRFLEVCKVDKSIAEFKLSLKLAHCQAFSLGRWSKVQIKDKSCRWIACYFFNSSTWKVFINSILLILSVLISQEPDKVQTLISGTTRILSE